MFGDRKKSLSDAYSDSKYVFWMGAAHSKAMQSGAEAGACTADTGTGVLRTLTEPLFSLFQPIPTPRSVARNTSSAVCDHMRRNRRLHRLACRYWFFCPIMTTE
jgi:hypothetical protein